MSRSFDKVAINDPVTLGELGLTRSDIEQIQNPSQSGQGGGGATNTGDAIAADVASGKVFSSAALTNVAGTSTKNATVPNDAPIQPPQAFVDAVPILLAAFVVHDGVVNLSGFGITEVDGYWTQYTLAAIMYHGLGARVNLNLSNNALSAASIADLFENGGGPIDVSGGTNAEIAITDDDISDLLWGGLLQIPARIKFNVRGHVVDLDPDTAWSFAGGALTTGDVNYLLSRLANYHTYASGGIPLDLSGGTNAAPTGQGLIDKQTLIDNGWTVTTN